VVRRLTSALGIVPGAEAPIALLLGVVAAAFVIANLLALIPATRGARANLRDLAADR
jgi:hypothetical protein